MSIFSKLFRKVSPARSITFFDEFIEWVKDKEREPIAIEIKIERGKDSKKYHGFFLVQIGEDGFELIDSYQSNGGWFGSRAEAERALLGAALKLASELSQLGFKVTINDKSPKAIANQIATFDREILRAIKR